jgi:hypothetical protein
MDVQQRAGARQTGPLDRIADFVTGRFASAGAMNAAMQRLRVA